MSRHGALRFDCIKLIWGDAWNDLVDNDHDGKLIEAGRMNKLAMAMAAMADSYRNESLPSLPYMVNIG